MREKTEMQPSLLVEVLWQLRFYAWAVLAITILLFAAPAAPAVCGPPNGGNPGCAGAGNPVHLATGNKFQEEIDLAPLPGVLGLEFIRYYNSRQNDFGSVGRGWRHSYDTSLRDVGNSLQIMTADGRRIIFARNTAQPALCASTNPDDGRVVVETRSTGQKQYRWQRTDGSQQVFDHDGQLTQIQAASGEQTLIARTPRGELLSVTDPQGRVLRFIYAAGKPAAAGAHRGIVAVDTPLGHLAFSHTPGGKRGAGNLVEVKRINGSLRRYRYSADDAAIADSHLLTAVLAVAAADDGRAGTEQPLRSFTYNEQGRVVRSEMFALDPTQPKLVLNFSYQEASTDITDESGQVTRVRYALIADDWRVIEVSGAGCAQCPEPGWRYRWNKRGQLESAIRIDAAGAVHERTQYQRDQAGRVLTAERFIATATVPSAWVRYRYEGDSSLPVEIARPSMLAGKEHLLAIAYNAQRQPMRVLESGWQPAVGPVNAQPLNRTTELSYRVIASSSRLAAIDGPLPGSVDTTTYHYDDQGRMAAVRFPSALMQRFGYDTLGRVIQRVDVDGAIERLAYDSGGALQMTSRANAATWFGRDLEGRVNRVRDPIGQRLFVGYDAAGHPVSLADAQGNRIALTVDSQGRVQAQTLLNPNGTVAGQTRNAALGSERAGNEIGRSGMSRLISAAVDTDNVARPAPTFDVGEVVARFADLDRAVARSAAYDAQGRPTEYILDDFGRLIAEISPVSGTTRYDYDFADRLIRKTAADGGTVIYERDAAGRVVRVQTDGEDARIEWGAANKPARIKYLEGEEQFQYDTAARLIEHTRRIDGKTFTTRYEYDANGRMQKKRLPDGQVLEYRYRGPLHPKPGVLESVWLNGAIDVPLVTELNRADETYNARGFVFGNGLAFGRELDVGGRVLAAGNLQVGRTQLTYAANDSVAAVQTQASVTLGNRARADVEPALLTRMHGELQTTQWFGSSARSSAGFGKHPQSDDTLTAWMQSPAAAVVPILLDARGRVIEQGNRHYVWDGLNRLIEVRDISIGQTERLVARYRYNAFGERIAKVVFDDQSVGRMTYYLYDGSALTAEADESGQVRRQYVHLDQRPLALLEGTKVYAVHTDHRLAPLAVTDAGRRVVWQARLGDTGAAMVDPASTLRLDLRGSNQLFDAESGLHYNTHRYLDPRRGRYLSPDPLGLAVGRDLYQFALGQPHRYVDLAGLQPSAVDYKDYGSKLKRTFELAIPLVPDEIGRALQELITPENIAAATAIFAVWAGAQFTPFGWAADLALGVLAFAVLGTSTIDLFQLLLTLHRQVSAAKCESDLEQAGKTFAKSIVKFGEVAAAGAGAAAAATKAAGSLRSVINFGKRQLRNPTGIAPPATTFARPSTSSVKYPADMSPWRNSDGSWRYPAPNGFAGPTARGELPLGTLIDRFGPPSGSYLSPVGTPFELRALPPDTIDAPYYVYRVIKPLPVTSGDTAAAFGLKGGGVQYLLERPLEWYLQNGYIAQVMGPL